MFSDKRRQSFDRADTILAKDGTSGGWSFLLILLKRDKGKSIHKTSFDLGARIGDPSREVGNRNKVGDLFAYTFACNPSVVHLFTEKSVDKAAWYSSQSSHRSREEVAVQVSIKDFVQGEIAAGSLEGKKVFLGLLEKMPSPRSPSNLFLDFKGIEVATTSFLRESVVAFKNYSRNNFPNIYPICSNLQPNVREELGYFLLMRGDAIVVCDINTSIISNAEIIGLIEGKQLAALRGMLELGEADTRQLREHIGENVAPTAWNNRLNALVEKGVMVEISSGRNKRFRPVLENMKYGH